MKSSLSASEYVFVGDVVELCRAELCQNRQKNISDLTKVSRFEKLIPISSFRVNFDRSFTIEMQEQSVLVWITPSKLDVKLFPSCVCTSFQLSNN